jgi:hypothetical protein
MEQLSDDVPHPVKRSQKEKRKIRKKIFFIMFFLYKNKILLFWLYNTGIIVCLPKEQVRHCVLEQEDDIFLRDFDRKFF